MILPVACKNGDPSWFGFLITCEEGVDRNKVVQYVESKGVQTRMLFAGNLTKHPAFIDYKNNGGEYRIATDLSNTDIIMNNSFWIGVYPGMTEEKLRFMAKTVIEAVNQ